MEHIGCVGYAHETYLVWGDDVAANRAAQRTNFADSEGTVHDVSAVAPRDLEGRDRARAAARFVTKGPGFVQHFATASCEVAAQTAGRLGLPQEVQLGLRQYAEWWNGKGDPAGAKGEDIALTARVVHVASVAAKFDFLGGPELAVEAVRRRAGTIFDPTIAATFVAHARELLASAARRRPSPPRARSRARARSLRSVTRLPEVAAAFGDLADLKTPFTHGHSAGVARLARAAGERLGLDTETMAGLEVAALLHDVGRVAISNAVWEKPGPLTSGEWEQVRLHPYHSERILSCTAALEPMAALAGVHHERMDGSGYHRGCSAAQIPLPARVLAAADALQAMTQDRPHRDALTVEEAVSSCSATLGRAARPRRGRGGRRAAGGPPRSAGPRPAGLSEREVEVLRLVAGRACRIERSLGACTSRRAPRNTTCSTSTRRSASPAGPPPPCSRWSTVCSGDTNR